MNKSKEEYIEYLWAEAHPKVEELVNNFIKKWLPSYFAHLVDSDENDGQLLRTQLTNLIEAEKARAVEEVKYHLEMIILSCDDSTLGSVYVSFDKKAACSGRSLDGLGFEYRKRLSKLLQGKKRG